MQLGTSTCFDYPGLTHNSLANDHFDRCQWGWHLNGENRVPVLDGHVKVQLP
jgi:hypothetical protein